MHIIAKNILRCHCEFCEHVRASVIQLVSCKCACRAKIADPLKARLEGFLAEQQLKACHTDSQMVYRGLQLAGRTTSAAEQGGANMPHSYIKDVPLRIMLSAFSVCM